MTKNEFMSRLESELKKRNVKDCADVIEEYEQHFAFKLEDGYSEEEIAARLGDPLYLAKQFEPDDKTVAKHSSILTRLWLGWVDLFFGIFAVIIVSFGITLVSCVIAFGLTGICLIGNLGSLPVVYLPPIPYWCGAILGMSISALCVLSLTGCIWYFAFCRQIFRAYGRFHRNALAQGNGGPILPGLSIVPKFEPKKKRRLRTVTLISLLLFAACLALGYAACGLSAKSFEFWHVWGWFLN